jgi:DNA-binding beta-propeller fold protein YncE
MRQLGAALSLTFALALAFTQSANADNVDRTYTVGEQPFAIVIDPADGHIYTMNRGTSPGSISVIDPASGLVTGHSTSGAAIAGALDTVHRRLYVANSNGTLDVFDLTTMGIVATLPVFGEGLAVNSETQRVYVAGRANLTVIDGVTNTILATTPGIEGEAWSSVALDPSLHRIYVTNYRFYPGPLPPIYPSLIVIDDRDLSIVTELRLPVVSRWALAVDQARHRVYVAGTGTDPSNGYLSMLLAFDGASLGQLGSAALPGAGGLGGIALGTGRVYVTVLSEGYYEVDSESFVVTQAVSTLPLRPFLPATDPQGRLYFGSFVESGLDIVVTISFGNHAPLINSATLSPGVPTTTDPLSFNVVAVDTDFAHLATGQHDALTFTYEWARNGTVISGEASSTLELSHAGAGDRGDTIAARVTVSDPQGLTVTASASVVIANASPATTVSLSNVWPRTNDVLIATASAPDADGDQVNLTYAWTRNGAVIPGASGSSLDLATQGDEGDVVAVIVTASDGHGSERVARASALVVPDSGNFLAVRSEPGDYVGAGIEILFTPANAEFHPGELLQGGDYVIAALQQATHIWRVDIAAPPGQPLSVGPYTGAARAGSPRSVGTPGLDVTTDSRYCNALTGQFDVNELEFSIYGELKTLDVTFEQRCIGATGKLVGRLRIEVPVQTPGVTLPPGSITVPATGNFLYFNGEPGDYIYPGEQLFTAPPATMTSSMSSAGDYFRGRLTPGFWGVDIAAPAGQPLAVGSYIRAARTGWPSSALIDVNGDGRGCSGTTGKFDVDELTYADNGQILVFQATFEQHCEGRFSPALYGRIRIENPAPGPLALPPGAIVVPTSGTFLYVNSQTGDYVGAGAEHLYTSPGSTILGELSVGRDSMKLAVGSSFSEYLWRVDLASASGTPLSAGAYPRAVKAEFRPAGSPGIDVIGEGRGCFRVTGRFNVDEMSFWANGDLRVFQATFEYHCDGSVPGLFGRLRFEALPPVTLGVTLREEGGVSSKSGVVTISGTVSCSRNVAVSVSGTLSQPVAKRATITGSFALSIDCVAPKTVWSATLVGDNGRFAAGQATATVTASACESNCVTATETRGVKLNSAK